MDRRSWLWRRKSSDKSPGETESSGSISSHSERFYDEQAYLNHNMQSPEVTSKAIPMDDELDDSLKTLREKLASALQNISAKEDLVKQHSKVAEEAVSGWEKAENEVLTLKQQVESLTQKSKSFEDRAIHLDVALKECMRQLRHEREEQEQKIREAINKENIEWEIKNSEFEKKLVDLQSQLQAAKAGAATSLHNDLRLKLESAEKDISYLKQELFSRAEELELRTIERDLSSEAAESASRQNLENVKKVAKLETECRRLKALARKASSFNEQRSVTESSICVESFTDSQSDTGERLLLVESDTHKINSLLPYEWKPNTSDSSSLSELPNSKKVKAIGRNCVAPSLDISLMDDFLEMERFVALPDTRSESFNESRVITAQSSGEDISLSTELATIRNQKAEVNEKLVKMEAEKNELETSLTRHQDHIKTLTDCLEEAEMKLVKMETDKNEVETSFSENQHQLRKVRDRLEEAETKLAEMETDKYEFEKSLAKHQDQLGTVRGLLEEAEMKLVELQAGLAMANEAREAIELELNNTNITKEVAQSQLEVLNSELKSKTVKISCLQEELQKERSVSEQTISSCQKLEQEISRLQHECELLRASSSRRDLKQNQDSFLRISLIALLFYYKLLGSNNIYLYVGQDQELAVAAYKFSECQKTIASLGRQLKSLATLEDFLLESDNKSTNTIGTTSN